MMDGLVSLYVISILFGLFQGGLVPSYAIIVRENFPAREAGSRLGLILMMTLLGMAAGGWIAGLLYDHLGYYAPAFAVGIGVLFLTALQSGVLGALLATSTRVWYPQQGTGAAAWGLTPLEDQQLAGLIMWVPAGFLYVVAMAVLFWAWMGRAERHPAVA